MVFIPYLDRLLGYVYYGYRCLPPGYVGRHCLHERVPSFPEDSKDRTWKRGVFNILGCGIFLVLYNTLPAWLYPYIGVIGGIGVGYSAGYSWQTVFNTFGALSIAGSLFGVKTAIALRIGTNVAGALYAFLSWQILSRLLPWIFGGKDPAISSNNHTLHRHFFPALAEGFPTTFTARLHDLAFSSDYLCIHRLFCSPSGVYRYNSPLWV